MRVHQKLRPFKIIEFIVKIRITYISESWQEIFNKDSPEYQDGFDATEKEKWMSGLLLSPRHPFFCKYKDGDE